MTRRPVHDRHQIKKAALNRNVGDVGTPDLIGTAYPQIPQQIRVNPVFRMGLTGSWRLIDRLQAHQTHQASNAMTADANALSSQLTRHLPGTVKWIFEKQLIDAPHQRQILCALPRQRVIE